MEGFLDLENLGIIDGLPVILGVQFLLSFLQFDYRNVPSRPLSARR